MKPSNQDDWFMYTFLDKYSEKKKEVYVLAQCNISLKRKILGLDTVIRMADSQTVTCWWKISQSATIQLKKCHPEKYYNNNNNTMKW